MSSLEKRAWLTLWSMLPPYFVYFALQAFYPQLTAGFLDAFLVLGATATVHAIAYIVGFAIIKHRERGEQPGDDASNVEQSRRHMKMMFRITARARMITASTTGRCHHGRLRSASGSISAIPQTSP